MTFLVVAVTLGVAAGVLSGLFGVGGGILFVPILLALGLSAAERGGDLAARDPADRRGRDWRQQRYGNVRWRSSLVLGLASIVGVAGGIRVADVPERRRPAKALRGPAARRCGAARLARAPKLDG